MQALHRQAPIKLVRRRIRVSVHRVQSLLALSASLSGIYLRLWGAILRMIDSASLRAFVYHNYLSCDLWPIERLRPRQVPFAGTPYRVTLVPHPGMIDFEAQFTSTFSYEPEVVRFLEQLLPQIDRVVEIGANVGIFTVYFSRSFAERGHGRIYAFEPSPRTFQALLDNLLANRADNVTPVNVAVSSKAGVAAFYEPTVAAYGERTLARSSLIQGHAEWHASEVREYPVLTVGPEHLEALLKEPGRTLVKLDIEGAEQLVLQAMESLLDRFRPHIVLEALANHCEGLNKLDFLRRIYRLFHLTDHGLVEHERFISDTRYEFNDYYLQPR